MTKQNMDFGNRYKHGNVMLFETTRVRENAVHLSCANI